MARLGKQQKWASTRNVQRAPNASQLATAWHLGCEQSVLTTSTGEHEDNIPSLFSVYSLESLRLFSKITNTQPTQSFKKSGDDIGTLRIQTLWMD